MKRYITLCFWIIVLLVLDYYANLGLHTAPVASFRADSLYQLFTGTVFDWTGLVIVHLALLVFGLAAAKEADFYEKTPYGFIILLLGSAISGMLLMWLF